MTALCQAAPTEEFEIDIENERRFARFKVAAPVLIERGDAPAVLGLTSDAAVGGCCITLPDAADWRIGETLRLTFDGQQPVAATIRRSAGHSIAVEFERAFSDLVLDHSARPVRITAGALKRLPMLARESAHQGGKDEIVPDRR